MFGNNTRVLLISRRTSGNGTSPGAKGNPHAQTSPVRRGANRTVHGHYQSGVLVMNNWKTIAVVALALSLILPSLAVPEERPGHVTGQVLAMDGARGVLVLLTKYGVMYLEGPPKALEGVKVGDVVEVSVLREAVHKP